jgi:hypothetical protein
MAFPIAADVEFFQSRQRVPAWASRIQAKRDPGYFASIDNVVNAHAGARDTAGEQAAHNMLVLVRSYLKRRQDLVEKLQELAGSPGCAFNPEKRAAFARKWARRLAEVGS